MLRRASQQRGALSKRCALAIGLGCLAVGCGGGKKTVSSPVAETKLPDSAALRYLPLVDGNQWAYDAEDEETREQGMFVTRARRVAGPRFSLISSQGSHTLEVRADGITRSESDAYVLKVPLASGAEWPGEGGATVRVASLDRVVDCPAGKFVGCVETIEETRTVSGKDPVRRVTTTYCPDVGVTLLRAEVWRAGKHSGERATLRSFGKPVQFDVERSGAH